MRRIAPYLFTLALAGFALAPVSAEEKTNRGEGIDI
jgi:hypothetical protein